MRGYFINPFLDLKPFEILTILLDILIVYYLIYRVLLLIRGTRAVQMLVGLLLLTVGYFASKFVGLTTVRWILDNFTSTFILVIIVVFAPEIRRGLTEVGRRTFQPGSASFEFEVVVEEVIKAVERLASMKIGALIVIQREADLTHYTEPGIQLQAKVTKELLFAAFIPDRQNPLHDGAVILSGNRVIAAACFLPLTASPKVDRSFGTRHRAAMGLTEETDAVVIVVSEEKGTPSLVMGGRITKDLDYVTLRKALRGILRKGHDRSKTMMAAG